MFLERSIEPMRVFNIFIKSHRYGHKVTMSVSSNPSIAIDATHRSGSVRKRTKTHAGCACVTVKHLTRLNLLTVGYMAALTTSGGIICYTRRLNYVCIIWS
jgi:hypothetical protein